MRDAGGGASGSHAGEDAAAGGAGREGGTAGTAAAGAAAAVPLPQEGAGSARPGPVRRLYDWVLHWADTPYGAPALFLLAVAESSFFPIPPDPLLIALCMGAAARSLRFAALTTVASVLGGIIGYGIGAGAWHLVQGWFFAYVPGVTPELFTRVQGMYEQNAFWAVFMAGLTPIPYKVFTLSAGVFSINFTVFVVASVLSRGMRFFMLAGLIYLYGPAIGRFIDRYFDWLAWAFGILLVVGFVVIELVL